MNRTVIIEIITTLLMILYLYTAINKLMDFRITRIQLADTPIIGQLAPFIAWAVPIVELAIVTLLFIPTYRLVGLYASSILMLVFTFYVIALVSYSTVRPCSCGGVLQVLTWEQHISFNMFFTGLSFWGLSLYRNMQRQRSRSSHK